MIILYTILILVLIGALMGLLLAVANKFLLVEEDKRKEEVLKMMPGANCGSCGYPGCSGLVDAIIEGKITKVTTCSVIKKENAGKIKEYLDTTPGADGTFLKVDI